VGDDGDRGDYPQLDALQKRRGYEDAVDKVVKAVTDGDHQAASAMVRSRRVIVGFVVLDVIVAP
jgi:hypothetical protein